MERNHSLVERIYEIRHKYDDVSYVCRWCKIMLDQVGQLAKTVNNNNRP